MTIKYDQNLLVDFEAGIDPLDPEHSKIPAQVLGYGEISTVLTINGGNLYLVYKRMPMFQNKEELERFLGQYETYLEQMTAAGIKVVPAAITSITPQSGNIVVYIIQQKFDPRTLAHLAIHSLPTSEVERIFNTILEQIGRGRSPGRAIEN